MRPIIQTLDLAAQLFRQAAEQFPRWADPEATASCAASPGIDLAEDAINARRIARFAVAHVHCLIFQPGDEEVRGVSTQLKLQQ